MMHHDPISALFEAYRPIIVPGQVIGFPLTVLTKLCVLLEYEKESHCLTGPLLKVWNNPITALPQIEGNCLLKVKIQWSIFLT